MAHLHKTTLTPSKAELLSPWLHRQPWSVRGELVRVGSYRLDDPAGEVGMEGVLLHHADSGVVLHVPLTYRAAPIEGAEAHLVGTAEHGVLGTRWVYDAVVDPVYLAAFAKLAIGGGTGAEEYFEVDGEREMREPSVRLASRGARVSAFPEGQKTDADVSIHRKVAALPEEETEDSLVIASWDGGSGVLGYVRTSAQG